MTTIRHLLAATDLSTPSLHAVDRGFEIARSTGAHYTVIHALELDALAQLRELLGEKSAAVSEKIADEARDALRQLLADGRRNRGVSAGLHLAEGRAKTAVLAHADAIDADLIVLGAQGKGHLQRFLLGSTVSRVLRKSRSPVLVVKDTCHEPYQRVLVAVDISPASLLAVRLARQVAGSAELILLHVYEVPFEGMLHYAGVGEEAIELCRIKAREQALWEIHELIKAADIPAKQCRSLVLEGDAARRIIEQEDALDCDLIVLGKHGTHEVEELLLGSVTKHVLDESHADVLVVTDRRVPAPAAHGTKTVSS